MFSLDNQARTVAPQLPANTGHGVFEMKTYLITGLVVVAALIVYNKLVVKFIP